VLIKHARRDFPHVPSRRSSRRVLFWGDGGRGCVCVEAMVGLLLVWGGEAVVCGCGSDDGSVEGGVWE
jgi:hypothetical protein